MAARAARLPSAVIIGQGPCRSCQWRVRDAVQPAWLACSLRGRGGVRDRGDRVRVGPGSRLVREAPHGAHPAQRVHVPDPRAPRGARLFVRDPCRRRVGPGGARHHRAGAHVRAHGVQGHAAARHEGLREGEGRARGTRGSLPGLRTSPRGRETRPGRGGPAAEGLQGEGSGRPGVRGRQRLRRGALARGWGRPEREHQRGGDDLLLLAADQQVRAVCLSRVRALHPPRVPGVLQGARRRDGGAPTADREPAHRQDDRADARDGLPRASVQAADGRLHERPAALHAHRRRARSSRSTTCRPTW